MDMGILEKSLHHEIICTELLPLGILTYVIVPRFKKGDRCKPAL